MKPCAVMDMYFGTLTSPSDEEDGEGDEEQEDVRHHVERVHEAAVVEHAVVHVVGGGVALVAAESQGHGGTLRAARRLLRAHPGGDGAGCPAAALPAPDGGGRRAAPALPSRPGPPRPRPAGSPLLGPPTWAGSEDAEAAGGSCGCRGPPARGFALRLGAPLRAPVGPGRAEPSEGRSRV